MKEFAQLIIKNLNSNGFPQKKVSLPTEKMYEVADNKGVSLNKVLDYLKENESIESSIETEKIIFTKITEEKVGPDFNFDPQMLKQAQEMMKNMDPEELKKIQEQVMGMSQEQRDELMKKAKSFGLS